MPEAMPKSLLVDRLGRHRHRVRLLLPHDGRRGDGGRGAAADPAGRGCRDRRPSRASASRSRASRSCTGAKVTKVDKKADGVTATIDDGKGKTQTITVDRVISAVGVVGNIENLGLEALGVKIDRGTSSSTATARPMCRASTPSATSPARRCWRTRPSMRASSASRRIAGLQAAPDGQAEDPRLHLLPPAGRLASASPRRRRKEAGCEIKVGRFPFIGNGKAIALGETEGLVKTIFDAKTGELLGAHMVGAEVTELIQGFVVAMNLRDDRGRADAHRLPASDAVGDDARSRARRLWARAERLECCVEAAHSILILRSLRSRRLEG